ncbi:MAG: urease accessory protein UreD [Rhodospirillales bacterium]|nr:urease accessory protein UreD [Rhodospirillales bacterium]
MSVASLPSEPDTLAGSLGGVHGAAEIGFTVKQGETRLEHLYQHDPLRVMFPTPPAGEPPCAVLITTSGGMVGGDRLDISVTAGPDTTAMAMAGAAEKVYRSAGEDSRINVRLSVQQNGCLEWLPQETILFDGARLRRRTIVDLQPGARILAGEILVFGRIASGERMSQGLIREAWELRRDGRLVWADALHLDGDMEAVFANPACFDGATAMATAIYSGDDAAQYLEQARALLGEGTEHLRCGATVINGVLVLRWLGRDAEPLRRAFGKFWAAFRHASGSLPATLPRLWNI